MAEDPPPPNAPVQAVPPAAAVPEGPELADGNDEEAADIVNQGK